MIDLLPQGPSEGGDAASAIRDALPGFLAYAISFAVIALTWMGHHRKFQVIKRWDGRLIQLNFLLLFVVAFAPYPTSLLSDFGGQRAAVILYASVVVALNLIQLAMWVYAWRAKLVSPELDRQLYRYSRNALLAVPTVFALSIVIALFDARLAMVSWLLLFPIGAIEGWMSRRAQPSGDASASSDSGTSR